MIIERTTRGDKMTNATNAECGDTFFQELLPYISRVCFFMGKYVTFVAFVINTFKKHIKHKKPFLVLNNDGC